MRPSEEGLLLLCCKLGQPVRPLSPSEYKQLESYVRAMNLTRSKDDFYEVTPKYLASLGYSQEMSLRIHSLLDRPEVLKNYLAAQPDISVITRISEKFPHRLRRLGNDCPPALFGKGDTELLNSHCIALVGSRMLFPRGSAFARRIGTMAAEEGFTLVSGGASGADSVAQEACLAAGGYVICFVPDALETYPSHPHVLYCCAEGYDLPFSNARALRRNYFIHAMGEKTFVAQCPRASGGTWNGSMENLKHGWSEVYVLNDGSEGAEALANLGATFVSDDLPPLFDLLSYQLSIFD